MSNQNMYMEFVHPDMYSMQVSPGQFRMFNYRVVNAQQKKQMEDLEKKLDKAELQNKKLNEELEEKTTEILNLDKEKQQIQRKFEYYLPFKEESRKWKKELQSCFVFLRYCSEDSEYFSKHKLKLEDFLKTKLMELQIFYTSLYDQYATKPSSGFNSSKIKQKSKEVKILNALEEEKYVEKIDFSLIQDILKKFEEIIQNDFHMSIVRNDLRLLKNRFMQAEFDENDKNKIEEITYECSYALALLIEMYQYK